MIKMETYFDLLPIELLGCITPRDYIYGFLKIFDDEKKLKVFTVYVQQEYPNYYKIYSLEYPEKTYSITISELFEKYIEDGINDIKDTIDEVDRYLYEGGIGGDTKWVYPIILEKQLPKVMNYLFEHPEMAIEYNIPKQERNTFYYDVTILLISAWYDFYDLISWRMSDQFKIKLLELSGYNIAKLAIDHDSLEKINGTLLYHYLIKNKIMVV